MMKINLDTTAPISTLASSPPPAASDTSRAKVAGHLAWRGGNLGRDMLVMLLVMVMGGKNCVSI